MATITGSSGDDTRNGTSGDDRISLGSGDDRTFARSGDDLVFGGSGLDTLSGSNGSDSLSGGSGDDRLYGGNDKDRLSGSGGDDRLYGGNSGDRAYGGAGNDFLSGGDNLDTLNGGDDEDRLSGGNGSDVVNGNAGDDVASGNEGNDRLSGGDGNDDLSGGNGNDRLTGGNGDDQLSGGDGNDTAFFSGNRAGYRITGSDEGTISIEDIDASNGDDGRDLLTSIEFFSFADGVIANRNDPPGAIGDSNGATNRVSEGSPDGTSAGITAAATDPDGDRITYSLVDNAGGRFAIDAETGVVIVADGTRLDYDVARSHSIQVRATDSHGEFSQRSFTIAVGQNSGTQGPLEDVDTTANRVDENAARGTLVGITAKAVDPDGDRLTYSIIDNPGLRFAIDARTGVVTVDDGLQIDFENSSTVRFTVQAVDGDGNASTRIFAVGVNNLDEGGQPTTGTEGNDTTFATTGNDTVRGLGGDDDLYGSPDLGGSDRDTMFGGDGNDRVGGRAGNDVIYGDDDPDGATGGKDTVYGGGDSDTVYGGGGNDILGGDPGNDKLYGGAGSDRLRSAGGRDEMTGGAGNDVFVLREAGDSNAAFGIDVIRDFDQPGSGNDVIELKFIDTDPLTPLVDDAFTFIGTDAFSAAAQVRYTIDGSDILVEGNLDSDTATAEFVIRLANAAADPLTAGDFIL